MIRVLSAAFLSLVANFLLTIFADKGRVELVSSAFLAEMDLLAMITNDRGFLAGCPQAFLLNWVLLGAGFYWIIRKRYPPVTKQNEDQAIVRLLNRH